MLPRSSVTLAPSLLLIELSNASIKETQVTFRAYPAKKAQTENVAYSAVLAFALVVSSS